MPEGVMYAILLGNAVVAASRPADPAAWSSARQRSAAAIEHAEPAIPRRPPCDPAWPMYRAHGRHRPRLRHADRVRLPVRPSRSSRSNRAEALHQAIFQRAAGGEVEHHLCGSTPRAASRPGPRPRDEGGRVVHAGYDAADAARRLRHPGAGHGLPGRHRPDLRLRPRAGRRSPASRCSRARETPGLGDKIDVDPAFLAELRSARGPADRGPRRRRAPDRVGQARRQATSPGRSTPSPARRSPRARWRGSSPRAPRYWAPLLHAQARRLPAGEMPR